MNDNERHRNSLEHFPIGRGVEQNELARIGNWRDVEIDLDGLGCRETGVVDAVVGAVCVGDLQQFEFERRPKETLANDAEIGFVQRDHLRRVANDDAQVGVVASVVVGATAADFDLSVDEPDKRCCQRTP